MRTSKFILLSAVLLAFMQGAAARFPGGSVFFQRAQLSFEVGYSQSFFKYASFNIDSEQGYRIDESSRDFTLHPNGSFIANIGYDVNDYFNIALCCGYVGISDDRRLYPLMLRLSYFPRSIWDDGLFAFAESGYGLETTSVLCRNVHALLADTGGGYRLKLSPWCNLDFMLSLRSAFDSPLIPNPDGPGYVSEENTRRSQGAYCSVNFSIALNF